MGSTVINPDPSTRCVPRLCETTPYPPCLNNGLCMEIQNDGDTTVNCSCRQEFFGDGCQFFDECSDVPCQNGGECFVDFSTRNQFTCVCRDGFEGPTCEEAVSACASSPCFNGARCVGLEDGSFQCICPAGFTGELCLTNINDCARDPCENGGVCTDGIDSFTCSCPAQFSGPICDIPVFFCSLDACANGGTCVEVEGGFTCACRPGFTGTICSADIDECSLQEPCTNGATCVNIPGSFTCFCAAGFTGNTCGTAINFCSNDTCSFNGVCSSETNGFVCTCDPGFTGDRCEVDIDECEAVECANGGTCMPGRGVSTCICDLGFTGTECEIDFNECQSLPCQNGGLCVNLPGDFSCECPSGFTGPTCAEQVDFCVGQICFNNGTCNSVGSTFSCQCRAGWSGDRCQFPSNVVVKLDSCGFTMSRDMLADAGLVESSEPLAISNGAPSVSFVYNLAGSSGIYFSGWVWQQSNTSSVLFSFSDDNSGSAGKFISDLTNAELRFFYSSDSLRPVGSVAFKDVPLRPNTWMHIAFAALSDHTILVNIDGAHSERQFLEMPPEDSFRVPAAIRVNIARGVSQLSSSDSAGAFSGLVRGIAINGILGSSGSFSLDTLQNCTLACIGGGAPCMSGSQCYDLYGPDRVCRCPYGISGLRCQEMHNRFSFEGPGFAQVNTQSPLESLQFSFKTEQPTGEIYSHSRLSTQTQIQLRNNRTIGIDVSHCTGASAGQSYSSTAGSFSDLQYHTLNLSNTLQLDGGSPVDIPVVSPSAVTCEENFPSAVLFGSFDTEQLTNTFQGCVRDVSYNGARLDASLLQFSSTGRFGCTRDTAQFYTFSHLELPRFISRESQAIALEFSTHSPSGVLYFSRRVPGDATGSTPNDFVAVHVQEGRAIFTFNLGEQDRNVVLQSSMLVNDGEWHMLRAVQTGTTASFYIDGVLMEAESTGPLVLLDTTGSVFIGGVPSGNRIAGFSNYAGFDGCIRDLEQNGVQEDLQSHISQTNVRFGVCN